MSWTKVDLVAFLDRKSIPRSTYSLDGDRDDAICLAVEGDEWLVYYSERGSRNHLGWGKTEAQALNIMKLFALEAHSKL